MLLYKLQNEMKGSLPRSPVDGGGRDADVEGELSTVMGIIGGEIKKCVC